jgi:carotenoid cleavage dioxygenase-like enzyme
MRRPWWLRLFQPVPRISDNVNVNVQPFAGGLVAMTEAPKQALIDAESLAVKSWLRYDDPLGAVSMTAHPVLDRAAGLVVNVAQVFGARPECILYQHAPTDLRRRVLARWQARELPYLHSFGLTPRRAVLIGHPLLVRPRTMLWSEQPFIEHFRWQPERGTRLVVLDRAGGEPRVVEADACFVFHVVNTYEERDATVVDALAYPARVVEPRRSPWANGGLRADRKPHNRIPGRAAAPLSGRRLGALHSRSILRWRAHRCAGATRRAPAPLLNWTWEGEPRAGSSGRWMVGGR